MNCLNDRRQDRALPTAVPDLRALRVVGEALNQAAVPASFLNNSSWTWTQETCFSHGASACL